MEELSELFNLVAEEKKKKKLEIESLVGDSFDKLFIEKLHPKKKHKKKNIQEKKQENKIVENIEIKEDTLIEKSLGLLSEPSDVKQQSDPLTPLDQNFVTFENLQNHYKLFISRIQQQLSTLGGGGETRFRYLDDVVGIATNPSAYDKKYLQWNSVTKKAEFTDPSDANSTTIFSITGITTFYQANNTDDYIGVNADVPVEIRLPISPITGKKIIVKDEGNKISQHNITVTVGAGVSVENDNSVVMKINHQSLTFFYNAQNWFII